MEATLIAPCGINCGICKSYLRDNKPCPGCHDRETKCVIKNCETIKANRSGFCFECEQFPCKRLKQLDEKHWNRYHMISMIENLNFIKEHGVEKFLTKEEEKWRCPECGRLIGYPDTFCFYCALEKRKSRKKDKGLENTEEALIAPCGMNCGVCGAYLAMKYDVRSQGLMTGYCTGCRPREKLCSFIKKKCQMLMSGEVESCYECGKFPCNNLVGLDKRYSERYHMSMIDNLNYLKEYGITKLLEKEEEKWKCPECAGVISCHNGICYSCGVEKLKNQGRQNPMEELKDEALIAPCGMNCGVCSSYLAMKNDLISQGVKARYCAGCRTRNNPCAFQKRCNLLKKGQVKYCYECDRFPCDNLEPLNKRYSASFHMSMIENHNFIKENGMKQFLKKEEEKWKCPECGGVISCHNGICFSCGAEKLKNLKKISFKW